MEEENEILKEIDVLSKYNVKKITLLGQNVNSYSFEGIDFPTLLERICDHIEKYGEDYRVQDSEHPIKCLRSRKEDNYILGTKPTDC